MVINALNANVKVFMADFEDSLAPDWNKVIDGQINLRDAVNGTISYTNEAGKISQLKPNPAVLICRVRGLHLPENMSPGVVRQSPAACLICALFLPQLSGTVGKGQWVPISICRKPSPGRKRPGGAKSSAMQNRSL